MLNKVIGTISKLAYTPIKSTALTEVKTLDVTLKGIKGDREWVLIEEAAKNGIHDWVSQRNIGLGKLALLQSKISGKYLEIFVPNGGTIKISNTIESGMARSIRIWNDVLIGTIDQGDDAAQWLSARFGRNIRLVKVTDKVRRPVSSKYLPNHHEIFGQDSYPIHWLTQESIDELNRRAGRNFSWRRFRPNIIVTGAPKADIEHTYFKGHFGNVEIVNAKPCDRCPMPLVDPETGERDISSEPLKTLMTYKRWIKPSGTPAIVFGEMALPMNTGTIVVGQKVVLSKLRNPTLNIS